MTVYEKHGGRDVVGWVSDLRRARHCGRSSIRNPIRVLCLHRSSCSAWQSEDSWYVACPLYDLAVYMELELR